MNNLNSVLIEGVVAGGSCLRETEGGGSVCDIEKLLNLAGFNGKAFREDIAAWKEVRHD